MAYDGSGPYDFRAEAWDVENASPLRVRRINSVPYDDAEIPDRDDLE